MASQIPPQLTAEQSAADLLRGSGSNNNFVQEDFLRILQISEGTYLSIRNACIRLLEKHADDENTRIDLRTLWNGHSGSQTKERMIDDLISIYQPIFSDPTRFNPLPFNWALTSRDIAKQFFVVANAHRSRKLPNTTPRRRQSPTRIETDPKTYGTQSVSATPSLLPQQSSPTLLAIDTHHLVSHGPFEINNITLPVVFEGETRDVAAWAFRTDGMPIEAPQYCRDVSLANFKEVIRKLYMTEESVEIYAPNSAGEYHIIQSDHHLQVCITRWMGLCAGNGMPPPCYFRIHSTIKSGAP